MEVPREILQAQKNVCLTGDIFFVQGYPFLTTMSRNIKFNTIHEMNDLSAENIIAILDLVLSVYTKRGFQVKDLLMDGQFNVIKNDLAERNVELNITSANEHVPDIERFIRVVKERSRAQYMALPYTKLPYLLVKAIVLHAGKWLNMFCPKEGISGNVV